MAHQDLTANEFSRLLAFTFDESGNDPFDEEIPRRKSKLLRAFKRYGRVIDPSTVSDVVVARSSVDFCVHSQAQSNSQDRRRPSIKEVIFGRTKSRAQVPRVSIFHEHLPSFDSSRTSSQKWSGESPDVGVADASRRALISKIIGPPSVRKLVRKGGKLFNKPKSVVSPVSSVPPILPPIERVSAIRLSRFLPHTAYVPCD
jgi:hypothetical protein